MFTDSAPHITMTNNPSKDAISADHADLTGRKEVMFHAYGMMLAFGYLFPAMAFYIRYRHRQPRKDAETSTPAIDGLAVHCEFPPLPSAVPLMALDASATVTTRPTPRAPTGPSSATYFIHGTAQVFTALLTFLLAGVVIANTYHNVAIHRTIGFTVLGLIVAQLGLGGRQLMAKMTTLPHQAVDETDGNHRSINWMRILHGGWGLLVIVLGLVQAGLGLNKLYPFAKYPFLVLHIAYYCSIVGWILAIVAMELRTRAV